LRRVVRLAALRARLKVVYLAAQKAVEMVEM
jgi:hypothetical protein